MEVYFDLETDDSKSEITLNERIICIGYHKQNYSWIKNDEKTMIEQFLDILKDGDILIGWNCNGYDKPLLLNRMKENGIKFNFWLKNIHFIDLMQEMKTRFPSKIYSYALEAIAGKFLNEHKIDRTKKIIEMNDDDLRKYNLKDVELMVKLNDKLHLLEIKTELCKIAGVPIQEGYLEKLIQSLIYKRAKYNSFSYEKVLIPQPYKKVTGALVLDPKTGYYDGVTVYDFKSLYPSLIRTLNVGHETFREKYQHGEDMIRAINEVYYTKDKKSVFSEITGEFIERRDKCKEEYSKTHDIHLEVKQNALKIFANAMYGKIISQKSVFYNPDMGNSITNTGAYLLRKVRDYLIDENYDVIYGHTDSIMLDGEHGYRTESMINEYVKNLMIKEFNIGECYTKMRLEKRYDKLLITDHNRHVGITDKGKLDIVGLEIVRSETYPYLAKRQLRLIQEIFDGTNNPKEFMETTKNQIYSRNLNGEEMALSQSLSKNLHEYKSETIPSKVARQLQRKGMLISRGKKMRYVMIGKSQPMNIYDYKERTYDCDYYWTRTKTALQKVIETANPPKNLTLRHWSKKTPTEKLGRLLL